MRKPELNLLYSTELAVFWGAVFWGIAECVPYKVCLFHRKCHTTTLASKRKAKTVVRLVGIILRFGVETGRSSDDS